MTEYLVDGSGQRWVRKNTIPPEPVQEWWWAYPDQFYQPIRECAPCPAVLVFGEIENPLKTHSVILDQKIQLFQADLLALSEYGQLYADLPRAERDDIARAWRGLYGSNLVFTNWWPKDSVRKDYVTPRDLDAENRIYDKIRGTAGNSFQGVIEKNSKGNRMLRLMSFTPDSIPSGYGVEILEHPAVFFATIQKATGAVTKFPQISNDVPVPLISKFPVYYDGYKVQQYFGDRRSPYYIPGLMLQILNVAKFSGARALSLLRLK